MKDEVKTEFFFHPSSFIPQPSTAALLLAAGKSRRMGAFKPLLAFGNRTVAEACIGNLLEAGIKEIVVVIGHRAEEMRERLAHLPIRFALNAEAESEMGVSIARGVEQISPEATALFIALVDQPAIPPATIAFLNEVGEREGAKFLVPEYEGRGGHPVRIDLGFRQELMNLDSQAGLRGLFAAHREKVLRVRVDSPYVARDMDRWDDYRALYREVFGTEPPESSGQSIESRPA
jgi:molybdenum cofactor cytidylyltransferase